MSFLNNFGYGPKSHSVCALVVAMAVSCSEHATFSSKSSPHPKVSKNQATHDSNKDTSDATASHPPQTPIPSDPHVYDGVPIPEIPPVSPQNFDQKMANDSIAGTSHLTPETDPKGPPLTGIDWFWQCAATPAVAPLAVASELIVQGGGDHLLSTSSIDNTALSFSGKICPPVSYARDIVFVIDVSGSMDTSDPRQPDGTCGRFKAIESMISDVEKSGADAHMGVVLFDAVVLKKSTALFPTRSALYADLTSDRTTIQSQICGAFPGTGYGGGLAGAESLLQTGSAKATKEVYFVSDGVPTDGTAGATVAARLRSPGIVIGTDTIPVTIATAMLGSGDDTVLRTKIASTDVSGKVLHAVAAEASNLADTLGQLAANKLVEASMKYRAIGTAIWQTVDLLPLLKDFQFATRGILIDKAHAPNGVEVQFIYKDEHNNNYSSEGRIIIAP